MSVSELKRPPSRPGGDEQARSEELFRLHPHTTIGRAPTPAPEQPCGPNGTERDCCSSPPREPRGRSTQQGPVLDLAWRGEAAGLAASNAHGDRDLASLLEQAAAARLAQLGVYGWRELHSFAAGRYTDEVDYLLIGPGGVVAVTTLCRPEARVWVAQHSVLVDGHRSDHLRRARSAARYVSEVLGERLDRHVPVRPALLALVGSLIIDERTSRDAADVLVVALADVPGAFLALPPGLGEPEIVSVAAAAQLADTWH